MLKLTSSQGLGGSLRPNNLSDLTYISQEQKEQVEKQNSYKAWQDHVKDAGYALQALEYKECSGQTMNQGSKVQSKVLAFDKIAHRISDIVHVEMLKLMNNLEDPGTGPDINRFIDHMMSQVEAYVRDEVYKNFEVKWNGKG